MRVTETLTFDEYWSDSRFRSKRPNVAGSEKQAFGDNIYHRAADGTWRQDDSHHSNADGTVNHLNVAHDTKAPRVLIGDDFVYWGGSGPDVPARFRNYEGVDICHIRGHKCRFPEKLVLEFDQWMQELTESGYVGEPLDWNG